MLDRRASQVAEAVDEAQKAMREAETMRLEYEKKLGNIDAEVVALKNESRVVIDETRQQMLKEAHQEVEAMQGRAREEIERQRSDAMRLHRNQIGELVTTLTRRMVEDVLNPQLHQAYLDAFIDRLRLVKFDGRVSTDEEDPVAVEVITAISLTQESKSRITIELETVVSHVIDLVCRVDEGLITGAMVRLGDTLIDGSLQGQLQQLRSQYEAESNAETG